MMTEKFTQYREEFERDWSASKAVREKSNEEYRFVTVAGGQWEGWLEEAYENRARLEFNKVSEFIRRTFSQWINNRQTVNYSPMDDATSEEDAELLDGLFRRDLQRDNGQSAIDTAVFEAMSCGIGAVVLNTEYEDEGDDENENQIITFTEQPAAYSTVVFDAAARRADKRDANRCTILTPYARDVFESMYPEANVTSLKQQDRSYFNWSEGRATDLVYVATQYRVEQKVTKIHVFANPNVDDNGRQRPQQKIEEQFLEDALVEFEQLRIAEGKERGYEEVRVRNVKRRKVYKTVFSGDQILEKRRQIVGEWIPVIPFYGFRHYVDGIENFYGLAREQMDPQRLGNMAMSLMAESAAHSHEAKPVFAPQQMSSPVVRAQWAGNIHQKAYLLAEPLKDAQGNIIKTGPSDMLPATQVSESLINVLNFATESLRSGTGGAPQDIADPNASGKAINALIKRIDQNTEPVLDNIRQSITHMGVVYASMAREIYGGARNAGRRVKLLNERGEAKNETLGQQAYINGSFGLSKDLSRAKFEVVAGYAPDYQTENEETFEAYKDLMAAMRPDDPLRDVVVRNLMVLKEAGGLKDFQTRLRRDLMIEGWMMPESEEDQQMVAQAQQAQANQPDQNAALMAAAAAEQESQAKLNEASIADKMASAAKKAVEAEKIKVEIGQEKNELRKDLDGQIYEQNYA